MSLSDAAPKPSRRTARSARAYYDRAVAYAAKPDLDEALTDYTEAIRLKPDLAEAYWGRGKIYEKKRDHVRAIADYDRAIRLKPDLAGAYCSRGNAYDNKGDRHQCRLRRDHPAQPILRRRVLQPRHRLFEGGRC